MRRNRFHPGLVGLTILLLSTLACEPVIAIGWEELLVLGIIIAILLGPMLLRFWRALNKLSGSRKKKDQHK